MKDIVNAKQNESNGKENSNYHRFNSSHKCYKPYTRYRQHSPNFYRKVLPELDERNNSHLSFVNIHLIHKKI